MKSTKELLQAVKTAASQMKMLTREDVDRALEAMAEALLSGMNRILEANRRDCEAARGKLSDAMLDRLLLTPPRIEAMASGVRALISLDTPFGRTLDSRRMPNGLLIEKIAVPLGAIGIIYESRPNVTSDAAALAIKSGNAVLLRSGKEAWESANAIVTLLKKALAASGLPEDAISLIEDKSRQSAEDMMKAEGFLDLLIPRGGKALIRACVEGARVPCIETGTGICHIYIDCHASLEMALSIVENAKTSRPSVCNAAEVLLVHRDIAPHFLPQLFERLVTERKQCGLVPVELRCDGRAAEFLPEATLAKDEDFDTEFLDLILAVSVVDTPEEAISHIAAHSTGHSEAIVTEDGDVARLFVTAVDSAAVYVNASTRFTDGGEFGLGCEMGISTQKLHARGPFGLEALTTYRYVINGTGQIR